MNYHNNRGVPASKEIKSVLNKLGISTTLLANMVNVDTSTARRWLMDEDNKSFVKMPWTVWIFIIFLFHSNREAIREEILSEIFPDKTEKETSSVTFIRQELTHIRVVAANDISTGITSLSNREIQRIGRDIIDKNWLPRFKKESHTRSDWVIIFEKHKTEIHDEIYAAVASRVCSH